MKILKIMIVSLIILFLSGCAGTGFQKKTTLMPDELSVSADYDPQENRVNEFTGGAKWKLQ